MKLLTQELADEIRADILKYGLSKGLGKPTPGKMCVEAMICYKLGLPHSDTPYCVSKEIRKAKISLNDCDWSSNKARAKGMEKLVIAQLGSDKLEQQALYNLLKLNSTKKILPYIIQKHYEKERIEDLLHWKLRFENLEMLDVKLWKEFYNYYDDYYYYDYYYDYYYYYDYNYYSKYYKDEFLILVADTILLTLQQMNCEGCKFL